MFGLWYLKEAPWKMGNNKKNPTLIRLTDTEKLIITSQNQVVGPHGLILGRFRSSPLTINRINAGIFVLFPIFQGASFEYHKLKRYNFRGAACHTGKF